MLGSAKVCAVLICVCSATCGITQTRSVAQPPPGPYQALHEQLPSNRELTDFLVQSLNWYRSVSSAERFAAEPADLFFIDDNQPLAGQILKLSFDFARADAALVASQRSNETMIDKGIKSSDFARIAFLKNEADRALQTAREEVAMLNQELTSPGRSDHRKLKAALEEAQSRLDLVESESKSIAELSEFVHNADAGENQGGDLISAVDDLARTVPQINNLSPSTSQSVIQAAAFREMGTEHSYSISGLFSSAIMLEHKLHLVDEMLRQTDSLALSEQTLRKPMTGLVNRIVEAGIADTSPTLDLAGLHAKKAQFEALTSDVNALSPAIVALDKQKALLAIYRAHLEDWRSKVVQQRRRIWKRLFIQLAVFTAMIVVLALIGRVLRKVTERRIHDADRRRIITLTLQVVTLLAICGVGAIGLGAEWKSLATFFGLLTAGIAVALQNVILATAGYFLLAGKRGIRVGDRIQFSGVTGDVIEIGLLQFQLKEYDIEKRDFTGRIATFSNSFVFVSPATGLVKLDPDTDESHPQTEKAPPVEATSLAGVGCNQKK